MGTVKNLWCITEGKYDKKILNKSTSDYNGKKHLFIYIT